ncbi:MAG: succinylglutamate desuccinylase/aspartoacylase family protein [Deltaproteobacteria bacterium]|nr:succinylglutamate desuccinylase/aspartoacylase family protein [Deltaproteobacteria bacterium]
MMVEMVHNALGLPISVPVIVMRGSRPGPVLGLTSALHGNELNGISVVHRLFSQLDPHKLRGTVVAVVVVNVPGYLAHRRHYLEGIDLNHIMPGDPHGNAPQIYAHRLVERFLDKFDFLVDLHTASVGRVNSLYVRSDMTAAIPAAMAYRQRPEIIVHNPPADRTLRGTAMEHDIPAITVEIGNPQQFQPKYIKSTLSGLRGVLAEAGLLSSRSAAPSGPEPTICSRSYWMYTDHGGLLEVLPALGALVKAGEPIARLTNAFGRVTRNYVAPEDAIIVGKSVDPVAETGGRIAHLGIVATEGSFIKRSTLSAVPAITAPVLGQDE